jgi:hypothetical protein
MIVASGRCFVSSRAASSVAEVPVALSFAPGDSLVAFITSVTRESMSPLSSTARLGSVRPRCTATTFTTVTSSLMRVAESPRTTSDT